MIPTAEKTLRSILGSCNIEYHELKESCPEIIEECLETIISQNKLYVQAALKAANKNSMLEAYDYDTETTWTTKAYVVGENNVRIKETSILNAYPDENIK
jgi:hypothetical protein